MPAKKEKKINSLEEDWGEEIWVQSVKPFRLVPGEAELCFVEILAKTSYWKAMVDTGATCCVVNGAFVATEFPDTFTIRPVSVKGINKSTTVNVGAEVTIKIGKTIVTIRALVIPQFKYPILLGNSFLKPLEAKIALGGGVFEWTNPHTGEVEKANMEIEPSTSRCDSPNTLEAVEKLEEMRRTSPDVKIRNQNRIVIPPNTMCPVKIEKSNVSFEKSEIK